MGHCFVGHFGLPSSRVTVGPLSYAVFAEEEKLFVYFGDKHFLFVEKRQYYLSLVEQLSFSSWSYYFSHIEDIVVRLLGKGQEIIV